MWAFLIIAVILAFVWSIIEKGFKHAENIERIKRGYPETDRDSRLYKEGERPQ